MLHGHRSRSMALLLAGALTALCQVPAWAASDEVEELRSRVEALESQLEGSEHSPVSAEGEAALAGGEDDGTGTDPRSFSTKFMPYYRYEKLKNDLEVNSLVLFGLIRFSENVAVTYEMPVAKRVDYNSVTEFRAAKDILGDSDGALPPGNGCGGFGGVNCTGVNFPDLDSDGDEVGMGDFNFRVFAKGFATTDSPAREGGQLEFMTGFETTIPSATEDVLGSGSLVLSPMAIFVMDMPLHGFVAGMNFYDFDLWSDKSRGYTSRYRGRWFYMQPLTPPDMGALGGFYLLPEFQPVYDFRSDHFSFWIGPELGKILAPGRILYVKPGFGVDQSRKDRQFTFETGFRWFF